MFISRKYACSPPLVRCCNKNSDRFVALKEFAVAVTKMSSIPNPKLQISATLNEFSLTAVEDKQDWYTSGIGNPPIEELHAIIH